MDKLEEKQSQISVIVPVHNGESYLEKCIESIIAQKEVNLEILVVNDGSTDDTASVCERLAARYDNLQIITLPDLGVSAARNHGLEQAKGDYITFVDADDRLRPGTLSLLYRMVCETGSDIAGCRFVVWKTEAAWKALLKKGEPSDASIGKVGITIYDNSSYLREGILQGNSRCWSKLYRRDLIGSTRFREGLTVGEDMLFLVELLPHIKQAVETTYPGYGYFRNPHGAMQRAFTPAYMDQIYCWEMAGELILKQDSTLSPQVSAQLMVAVMLVAGKIALLSEEERKREKEYLRVCRQKLLSLIREKGVMAFLPPGYGVKVCLFVLSSALYVRLYRIQKGFRRMRADARRRKRRQEKA